MLSNDLLNEQLNEWVQVLEPDCMGLTVLAGCATLNQYLTSLSLRELMEGCSRKVAAMTRMRSPPDGPLASLWFHRPCWARDVSAEKILSNW